MPSALGGSRYTTAPPGPGGVLDSDLLMRFLWLPRRQQAALAGRVGLTHATVLGALRDIEQTFTDF